MSENPNHTNGKEHPIRKALKVLPRIKAAPDFELRLQRRLGSTKRDRWQETLLVRYISGFRIPVYAYSLLLIIAIGFFFYYVLHERDIKEIPSAIEKPASDERYLQQSPAGAPPMARRESVNEDKLSRLPLNTEGAEKKSRASSQEEKASRVSQPPLPSESVRSHQDVQTSAPVYQGKGEPSVTGEMSEVSGLRKEGTQVKLPVPGSLPPSRFSVSQTLSSGDTTISARMSHDSSLGKDSSRADSLKKLFEQNQQQRFRKTKKRSKQ